MTSASQALRRPAGRRRRRLGAGGSTPPPQLSHRVVCRHRGCPPLLPRKPGPSGAARRAGWGPGGRAGGRAGAHRTPHAAGGGWGGAPTQRGGPRCGGGAVAVRWRGAQQQKRTRAAGHAAAVACRPAGQERWGGAVALVVRCLHQYGPYPYPLPKDHPSCASWHDDGPRWRPPPPHQWRLASDDPRGVGGARRALPSPTLARLTLPLVFVFFSFFGCTPRAPFPPQLASRAGSPRAPSATRGHTPPSMRGTLCLRAPPGHRTGAGPARSRAVGGCGGARRSPLCAHHGDAPRRRGAPRPARCPLFGTHRATTPRLARRGAAPRPRCGASMAPPALPASGYSSPPPNPRLRGSPPFSRGRTKRGPPGACRGVPTPPPPPPPSAPPHSPSRLTPRRTPPPPPSSPRSC